MGDSAEPGPARAEVPQFSIPQFCPNADAIDEQDEFYLPSNITLLPGQIIRASFGMMKFDEGAVVFTVDDKYMKAQIEAVKKAAKEFYFNPGSQSDLKPLDFEYVKTKKFLIVVAKDQATKSIVRGQVVRCQSDGEQVILYLLDHGNFGTYSIKDIYASTKKLTYIPIKNLCVILDGLDFFFKKESEIYLRLAMEHAGAHGLLSIPFDLKAINPNPITKSKLKDKITIPTVIANVLDKDTGERINFNKWLIKTCIHKSATAAIIPTVPGIKFKGRIVNLEPSGILYVQLSGSLADNVTEYLSQYKIQDFEKVDELHLENIEHTKMYLAQHAGIIYRCKPLEPIKPNGRNEIKIEYIDWGNIDWRLPEDLVEAGHICHSLRFIPPTVHKLSLANVIQFKSPALLLGLILSESKEYSFEVTEVFDKQSQIPHVQIVGKSWIEDYFEDYF